MSSSKSLAGRVSVYGKFDEPWNKTSHTYSGELLGLQKVRNISALRNSLLLATGAGKLFGIGRNDWKELGCDGSAASTNLMQELGGMDGHPALLGAGCQARHSVIYTDNGTLWSAGCNEHQQRGTKFPRVPYTRLDARRSQSVQSAMSKRIALKLRVAKIALGYGLTAIVTQAGRLHIAGGSKEFRICLQIKGKGRGALMQVQCAPPDITDIAVGANYAHDHMLLLTKPGYLYTAGSNENGQCAVATRLRWAVLDRRKCKNVGPIASIAAGCYHSAAVTQSGKVFCWGAHSSGQLGVPISESKGATGKSFTQAGAAASRTRPVQVLGIPADTHIIGVSCGGYHTVVWSNHHDVYAWGSNYSGQLMIQTEGHIVSRPVQITSLTHEVVDIQCGYYFTAICLGHPIEAKMLALEEEQRLAMEAMPAMTPVERQASVEKGIPANPSPLSGITAGQEYAYNNRHSKPQLSKQQSQEHDRARMTIRKLTTQLTEVKTAKKEETERRNSLLLRFEELQTQFNDHKKKYTNLHSQFTRQTTEIMTLRRASIASEQDAQESIRQPSRPPPLFEKRMSFCDSGEPINHRAEAGSMHKKPSCIAESGFMKKRRPVKRPSQRSASTGGKTSVKRGDSVRLPELEPINTSFDERPSVARTKSQDEAAEQAATGDIDVALQEQMNEAFYSMKRPSTDKEAQKEKREAVKYISPGRRNEKLNNIIRRHITPTYEGTGMNAQVKAVTPPPSSHDSEPNSKPQQSSAPSSTPNKDSKQKFDELLAKRTKKLQDKKKRSGKRRDEKPTGITSLLKSLDEPTMVDGISDPAEEKRKITEILRRISAIEHRVPALGAVFKKKFQEILRKRGFKDRAIDAMMRGEEPDPADLPVRPESTPEDNNNERLSVSPRTPRRQITPESPAPLTPCTDKSEKMKLELERRQELAEENRRLALKNRMEHAAEQERLRGQRDKSLLRRQQEVEHQRLARENKAASRQSPLDVNRRPAPKVTEQPSTLSLNHPTIKSVTPRRPTGTVRPEPGLRSRAETDPRQRRRQTNLLKGSDSAVKAPKLRERSGTAGSGRSNLKKAGPGAYTSTKKKGTTRQTKSARKTPAALLANVSRTSLGRTPRGKAKRADKSTSSAANSRRGSANSSRNGSRRSSATRNRTTGTGGRRSSAARKAGNKKRAANAPIFKGIIRLKGKWQPQVLRNGKVVSLGKFATYDEAQTFWTEYKANVMNNSSNSTNTVELAKNGNGSSLPATLQIGQRVAFRKGHIHAGKTGIITSPRGTADGLLWNIKLDNGGSTFAGDSKLEALSNTPQEPMSTGSTRKTAGRKKGSAGRTSNKRSTTARGLTTKRNNGQKYGATSRGRPGYGSRSADKDLQSFRAKREEFQQMTAELESLTASIKANGPKRKKLSAGRYTSRSARGKR